jgi:hypothetical protein
MTTIYMKKIGKALVPDSDEEAEKLQRFKGVIKCEITEMRNGPFFRKYWKLISVAFDYASANMIPRQHNGVEVVMCKDQFRKDITVMAGYYDPVFTVHGDVKLEAKSLQWSKMTEEDFAKLYSATIDVILQKVLPGLDEDDLNEALERTLAYA